MLRGGIVLTGYLNIDIYNIFAIIARFFQYIYVSLYMNKEEFVRKVFELNPPRYLHIECDSEVDYWRVRFTRNKSDWWYCNTEELHIYIKVFNELRKDMISVFGE